MHRTRGGCAPTAKHLLSLPDDASVAAFLQTQIPPIRPPASAPTKLRRSPLPSSAPAPPSFPTAIAAHHHARIVSAPARPSSSNAIPLAPRRISSYPPPAPPRPLARSSVSRLPPNLAPAPILRPPSLGGTPTSEGSALPGDKRRASSERSAFSSSSKGGGSREHSRSAPPAHRSSASPGSSGPPSLSLSKTDISALPQTLDSKPDSSYLGKSPPRREAPSAGTKGTSQGAKEDTPSLTVTTTPPLFSVGITFITGSCEEGPKPLNGAPSTTEEQADRPLPAPSDSPLAALELLASLIVEHEDVKPRLSPIESHQADGASPPRALPRLTLQTASSPYVSPEASPPLSSATFAFPTPVSATSGSVATEVPFSLPAARQSPSPSETVAQKTATLAAMGRPTSASRPYPSPELSPPPPSFALPSPGQVKAPASAPDSSSLDVPLPASHPAKLHSLVATAGASSLAIPLPTAGSVTIAATTASEALRSGAEEPSSNPFAGIFASYGNPSPAQAAAEVTSAPAGRRSALKRSRHQGQDVQGTAVGDPVKQPRRSSPISSASAERAQQARWREKKAVRFAEPESEVVGFGAGLVDVTLLRW
ncbi:uncharacterized protein JCM10292_001343 [Rhodotorula paludigena]|uniref:uncharacterized protein n=1 Tax=Rhodotorula paludigena TaxID=86838 RepID=UPI00317A5005